MRLWPRGVPCFQGSAPEIYLERAFAGTTSRPAERLPVARALGETSLAMLVHPTITDAQIDRACQALDEVLTLATA
jgi:dTDP-4-amino-4,6-dideoxygalactose transaminase